MGILLLVLAWLVLSVPLSVVVGRAIERGHALAQVRADGRDGRRHS